MTQLPQDRHTGADSTSPARGPKNVRKPGSVFGKLHGDAQPPSRGLSPFGMQGGHGRLRAKLVKVAQALVADEVDSLSGVFLSELDKAVSTFLGDLSLSAAGVQVASSRSRSLGSSSGPAAPSPSKLTAEEKLKRRQERKFVQAKLQGLI